MKIQDSRLMIILTVRFLHNTMGFYGPVVFIMAAYNYFCLDIVGPLNIDIINRVYKLGL